MLTISELVIFPIKACGGCSVPAADVVPGGLAGDRRYMLVDEQCLFVSRRTVPRLCLTQVTLRGSEFSVIAPDTMPLDLPFDPHAELGSSPDWGDVLTTEIWRNRVQAREHRAGSAWFSAFLDQEVRLVYMPDEALRQVNPAYARSGDVVSFADGYPILCCTEASLADLNGRMDVALPMSRFRPNVVVRGSSPFEEDAWQTIRLGDVECDVPKGCDRCVVTTLEEGTGHGSKEPLRTLATFRKKDGAVWFGVNLIPRAEGTLRVGQDVVLLARNDSA